MGTLGAQRTGCTTERSTGLRATAAFLRQTGTFGADAGSPLAGSPPPAPAAQGTEPPLPSAQTPARSSAATHARIPLPASPPLRLDGASAATETSPAGAERAGNAAPLSASRKSPRRRGVGGRPGAPGSERRGGRNRAQTPHPPPLNRLPASAPPPPQRLTPRTGSRRRFGIFARSAPACAVRLRGSGAGRGGAGPFCAGLRAACSSLPRSFSSAPVPPLFPSQSPHASGFKRGWPV